MQKPQTHIYCVTSKTVIMLLCIMLVMAELPVISDYPQKQFGISGKSLAVITCYWEPEPETGSQALGYGLYIAYYAYMISSIIRMRCCAIDARLLREYCNILANLFCPILFQFQQVEGVAKWSLVQ